MLEDLVPGAERDRAGSVVAVLGSGTPRRLVACPMDEWGYVVGRIRDDGWLSLRSVGGGAPWMFDQSHEGHRVTVWGDQGPIAGVMAVRSTHLARCVPQGTMMIGRATTMGSRPESSISTVRVYSPDSRSGKLS